MEKYVEPAFLLSQLSSLWHWFTQNALTVKTLLELAVIAFGLLMAVLFARPVKKQLRRLLETRNWSDRVQGKLSSAFLPLITYVLGILMLWIGIKAVGRYELPTSLIQTAARLLTAWLIIRFTTAMLRDSRWSRLFSITAWSVAALHILNLLGPTIDLLDQLAITLGGVRISLLLLIKGVIVFTVLLKLASSASIHSGKTSIESGGTYPISPGASEQGV